MGKIKKDGDNELFEATDLDTPPPRRCRNNNKGASCGRAFMSRSEKNKEGKKD